jgi:hypothetical protein
MFRDGQVQTAVFTNWCRGHQTAAVTRITRPTDRLTRAGRCVGTFGKAPP